MRSEGLTASPGFLSTGPDSVAGGRPPKLTEKADDARVAEVSVEVRGLTIVY